MISGLRFLLGGRGQQRQQQQEQQQQHEAAAELNQEEQPDPKMEKKAVTGTSSAGEWLSHGIPVCLPAGAGRIVGA